MKELFKFIKAKINTAIPEIKHVEMWRGQSTRERLVGDQNPFRTPAVFVEFIVDRVVNYSLGIKDVEMTVRFRFAINRLKFERLEDLDLQDRFDAVVTNMRGNGADTVQFSTLQETVTSLDDNFDAANEPYIDYSTIWRKQSAYRYHDDVFKIPTLKTLTGVFQYELTADDTINTSDDIIN